VILGLDCGHNWGWAVVDDRGAYVRSGHRQLPADLDLGPSCHRFSMAIGDLIDEFAITSVWAEKPVSQHYRAQRRLFAYPAIAALIAHLHLAGYHEINRSEAYRTLLGKGDAPKLSGVLFGRQYKPLLNSDDEGDALLVALAGYKLSEARRAA
jgi:Holliday junction resolvasome RuvABC endonuclease subunit